MIHAMIQSFLDHHGEVVALVLTVYVAILRLSIRGPR